MVSLSSATEEATSGGYDDGYAACAQFWGSTPGSLVTKCLDSRDVVDLRVLDAGCGDGKNAVWLAERGAQVLAFDVSPIALARAVERDAGKRVRWLRASARRLPLSPARFDVVIAYGLFHCLRNRGEVADAINNLLALTRPGGLHIVAAFNDGDHDLDRAHPGFSPHLEPHEYYLRAYSSCDIEYASDSMLRETHPHNGIPHRHSMTRLIARVR